MKKGIHPHTYTDVAVQCICGEQFTIKETTMAWPIKVETCYECHAAYHPEKNERRVIRWNIDKFKARQEKTQTANKTA